MGRHVKWFVKTKVGNNIQISLCNLNSGVKGKVAINYGNKKQVLEDDKMMDSASTNCEEAPYDGNVVMPGVVTSNFGTPSINLRPRCCIWVSQ